MRKRDKAITIRITEEEYALLCSKLAQTGISQQAFVINAITGIAIIPSEQTAVLKEISSTFASLEQQLRGMATNINQMARIANSRKGSWKRSHSRSADIERTAKRYGNQ